MRPVGDLTFTTRSAISSLPLVSGLISSAITTLVAATQVPTSMGMTSPT